jgi:hypothetical protein
VALSIALLLPSAAGAQQLPSDPEANSPSGVVYELPFDQGRKDAAPRPRDRRGERRRSRDSHPPNGSAPADESAPANGHEPTSIRSENNFGSSSVVPGLDDRDSGDDQASAGSGSGGGSDSSGGTLAPDAQGGSAAIRAASSSSAPSDSVAWLIALILVVGTALGLLSGRAWRRRSGA